MAASSSTAAAARGPPFPTALEREPVLFRRKAQTYRALVQAVHQGASLSTVVLKITERTPKRPFAAGEPATLQAADGGRWAGVIASPDDGDALPDSLYTWIHVEVPHQAIPSGELVNDSFLTIYPVEHKLQSDHSIRVQYNHWTVELSMDENNQLTDHKAKAKPEPKVFKLKVGVIGFGAIGRDIVETLADTEEVDLIAIVDNLTVYDMVMAWKSKKFSIRSCGEKAILFKRRTAELDKNDDIVVTFLNARDHEKNPWSKLSISYVIDTLNLFSENNKHIIYSAHGMFVPPPEEEQLLEDNHSVYSMVYDDEGVINCFNPPTKYMKIRMSTEVAKEAIVQSFPEWREGCMNLCFCAESDPTNRLCDPLTELHVNEEEQEAERKEAADRLISIVSCCIRVIRRAAIGGAFLMI